MADNLSSNPILTQVQQAGAAAETAISTAYPEIINARNTQQQLSDIIASTWIDSGNNSALQEQVKQAGDLQNQTARQKIGTISRTDASLQNERYTDLFATQQQSYDKKMEALQNIDKLSQVSFMDNPVGYIISQFSINDEIQKHNSAAAIHQAATGEIDDITRESSQAAQNQNNFKTIVTQASADAAVQNVLNTAKIAAEKSHIDGINYGIDAFKESVQAPIEQLKVKLQMQSSDEMVQNMKLRLAEFQLHKEEFEYKKSTQKESDDTIANTILEGARALGNKTLVDKLSANPVAMKQAIMGFKLDSPLYKELFHTGMTGILAGTPGALSTLRNSGMGFTPTETQGRVIGSIQDIEETMRKLPSDQQPKNKAEALEMMNKKFYAQFDADGKFNGNVEANDSNPMKIPDLNAVVGMPGVADTALAQKVLLHMAANKTLTSFDKVFTAGMDAVEKETISLGELTKGLEAIQVKGTATNLDSQNLIKLGIVPTKEMLHYPVQLTVNPNSVIHKKMLIDISEPKNIQQAVVNGFRNRLMGKLYEGEQ